MRDGKVYMYNITLECTSTKEIERNKVFLLVSDYKKMLKRIDEIVYRDGDKEWSLKKITT